MALVVSSQRNQNFEEQRRKRLEAGVRVLRTMAFSVVRTLTLAKFFMILGSQRIMKFVASWGMLHLGLDAELKRSTLDWRGRARS
jgi:hypothetical protein